MMRRVLLFFAFALTFGAAHAQGYDWPTKLPYPTPSPPSGTFNCYPNPAWGIGGGVMPWQECAALNRTAVNTYNINKVPQWCQPNSAYVNGASWHTAVCTGTGSSPVCLEMSYNGVPAGGPSNETNCQSSVQNGGSFDIGYATSAPTCPDISLPGPIVGGAPSYCDCPNVTIGGVTIHGFWEAAWQTCLPNYYQVIVDLFTPNGH